MHRLTGLNAWTRSEISGLCVCFATTILDSVQIFDSVLVFVLIQSKWKTWLTRTEWRKRHALPSMLLQSPISLLLQNWYDFSCFDLIDKLAMLVSVKLIIWNRFLHMLEIDSSILRSRYFNVQKLKLKTQVLFFSMNWDFMEWYSDEKKTNPYPREMHIFK